MTRPKCANGVQNPIAPVAYTHFPGQEIDFPQSSGLGAMEPLRHRVALQIGVLFGKGMQELPPMELSVSEAVFEVGGSMFKGIL